MSNFRPVFATIGNIIDLVVTCFLMFKGFVWGGIAGACIPMLLTGSEELSLLVVILGLIGGLIGALIGFLLSGIVSAALAPLYWAPSEQTYLPRPTYNPSVTPWGHPRRRSTNNPLQPHRHKD